MAARNYRICFTAKVYLLVLILCLSAAGRVALGQAEGHKLNSIVTAFDKHREQALQEKLYLHLDRPAYLPGETMWIKVYNVDGTLHQPSDVSKVAYVELLDKAKTPVLQAKVELKTGTGHGAFQLPYTLASGKYLVRSYTNWMKNFSPEFYFEQQVTIVNTFTPLAANTPAEKQGFAIQFFPEGGSMVDGIQSRVAFKAVSKATGKGVACEGEVVDQQGNTVARFNTLMHGMGSFDFMPAAANTYVAVVRVNGEPVLREKLPAVMQEGYSLRLEETDADQLKLTFNTTYSVNQPVYLLAHARQMKAVAKVVELRNGAGSIRINKADLPDGITHFTFFNSYQQPVCERLYFKRPQQSLQISTRTSNPSYSTRAKVVVDLTTQLRQTGKEIPANLSVAVFRLDSLNNTLPADIGSYLWLKSDLKGQVEEPSYYLTSTGPDADRALDNLMLTHGWSRFSWEQVLGKVAASYVHMPEYEGHLIQAKVTEKGTGNAAVGITAYLSSPSRYIRLFSAKSNKNGLLQFSVKNLYGPREVILQTNTGKDSTYRLQLLNPFSEVYSDTRPADLYLQENLRQDLTQRHIAMQTQQAFFRKYNNLYSPTVVDSTSFYGTPTQQYLLDNFTRFTVMEEVMREYVSGVQVRKRRDGFQFMVSNTPYKVFFQDNPLVLLDGMPVFDVDRIMAFDPLKIKQLDVMTRSYFKGSEMYSGIVSYRTYSGDLAGFSPDPNALLMEYEGLQNKREFYSPAYDTQQEDKLPDYRNLLYWNPEVSTTAPGKTQLQFYTSDVPGKYIIVLQGLTKNGLPGSSMQTFVVE